MSCSIAHKGIVREISDATVTVAITTKSACGDCHAKNICGFSEISEKFIHIKREKNLSIQLDEEVNIIMESSLGTKAVLLAYIIPLFLFMVSLFILLIFTTELIASLISVTLLTAYFYFLHHHKDKIEKKFSFSITK
ncbi:MAG: SoxR reducing system RseC family protein [Bacteroidales bacterium]|nr:SoxR reducing system RseC family protein [Bacteroidales bacterium]